MGWPALEAIRIQTSFPMRSRDFETVRTPAVEGGAATGSAGLIHTVAGVAPYYKRFVGKRSTLRPIDFSLDAILVKSLTQRIKIGT